MSRKKIAYQGEPGANSHIACADVYPDMEPLACPTFEDALAAISEGTAALGMIPIENSLAGRVADIHHFLPTSGLHIIGEYFLPIHFQLMAPKGATLGGLTDVYSHVHALGQCRRVIREHGLRGHVAGDTAGAAKQLAAQPDRTRGAIAPALAADLYGLNILMRDIEDETTNTTRFLVMSPEQVAPPEGVKCVTSFVFRVRNIPAALYKAMGGFATNGVNMIKLESYMENGAFTATMFYVEVEGRPADAGLARALEELHFFSDHFEILGTYAADPFRD